MTQILNAMPFPSARGERQNRVKLVEPLHSALLSDAEDRGVYRRLKVQANDICRLLFKLKVIASHLSEEAVMLNIEMAPDTADARLANAQIFGRPISPPVVRTVRLSLTHEVQDTRLGLCCTGSAWTTAMTLPSLSDILITASSRCLTSR